MVKFLIKIRYTSRIRTMAGSDVCNHEKKYRDKKVYVTKSCRICRKKVINNIVLFFSYMFCISIALMITLSNTGHCHEFKYNQYDWNNCIDKWPLYLLLSSIVLSFYMYFRSGMIDLKYPNCKMNNQDGGCQYCNRYIYRYIGKRMLNIFIRF